ncbi:hypothetical protein PLICRDRAFT_180364 [Plicaturopsis crispa FD-325 SS-3]|uniref:Uncharacterized protein n=1 Tax=Plicaturopsis crispa FD-325 SS-3 TaxID=944288 RepID=A0A0C9T2F8_PLICR|nr:hypothetical protein PLICRDRAFT_180364 [Plicaturopsis crispa FD-325 SS-3]
MRSSLSRSSFCLAHPALRIKRPSPLGGFISRFPAYCSMTTTIEETYQRPGDGTITWLDGKCLAVWHDFVITSPNVNYIPWFELGRCRVQTRKDGRFGLADFSLTPQRFSDSFPHSALIPEPPRRQTSAQAAFWLTPGDNDFEPVQGTSFHDVGHLGKAFIQRVEPFFEELREEVVRWEKEHPRDEQLALILTNTTQALGRLKYAAYSFRDLVNDFAYFSHNMLDLNARIAFVKKYSSRAFVTGADDKPGNVALWAIGAWTTEPIHVQWLLRAGIPVWYVRTKEQFLASMHSRCRPNVEKITQMQAPPGWVCTDAPVDSVGRPQASHIIYEGPSNDTLHAFSRRPLFLGNTTIEKLAELPAKAPDIGGFYDQYTVRAVSGPASHVSVAGDTRNAAVHKLLTSAKAAHDRQSMSDWRSEPDDAPPPSDAASSNDEEPLRHKKRKSTAQRNAAKRARAEDPNPPPKPVQRDKWEDPESDIIPPASPVWAAALKMVDQSPERLEPHRPSNANYQWPDPALFATTNKKGRFLVNWLAARQAWLARLTTSAGQGAAAGSNQMWRDYLGTKHDQRLRQGTFTARCRAQVEETFGVTMREKGPSIVYWQEAELLASRVEDSNGEQERHIMREVVWDACEHSFRFELRALDRLAGEFEWYDNPVGRDRMVAAIFGGSYTVDSVPNFNIGLLSDDMSIRMRSMEALRKVMKAWPDHPYEVKHLTYTEGMAEAFEKGQGLDLLRRCEKALAEFYCQTFYNWFGRPAIVPHFVPLRPRAPTP